MKLATIITTPVFTGDVAAKFWGGIQDCVLNILSDAPLWTSVNVFRYGDAPTILIAVRNPDDDLWWKSVLPNIRKHSSPHLEVEIIYADSLSFTLEADVEAAARG